jgi:hypothetical protein
MMSASLPRTRPAWRLGFLVLACALAVAMLPDRAVREPAPAIQDRCWLAPPVDLAPFACGEFGALTGAGGEAPAP